MNRFLQKIFQALMELSENSLPGETGGDGAGRCEFPGTEKVLSAMTLDEKMRMISGYRSFAVSPVPGLDLPPVWMSDATGGVRLFGGGTAFPCPLAMAAGWNPDLVREVAAAIGAECRERGVSILLGPGVNICRVPTGGRNFEYFGEDPFLAGTLAVSYLRGTRLAGVEGVVKHFACNNSEYDRHRENAVVDERTLRELYLPAFRMAVREGGARFIMTAYNQVNGVYASENRRLLLDILRGEWEFDGAVMSDWISTYSTAPAAKAGLDLEMPKAKRFSPGRIGKALSRKTLAEEDLDRMVRNILSSCERSGFYDDAKAGTVLPAAGETGLQIACEGIVLLKNSGILPLNRKKIRKVVVTGNCARQTPTGGGGSSYVKTGTYTDILDGISEALEGWADVVFLDRKKRLRKKDHGIIASADVVLVCAGFDRVSESEGYDRSWELPCRAGRLIRDTAAVNPAVVAVVSGGGAVETASWIESAAGVLHSFYLGQFAGKAVSKILFGEVNPSGRLPVTVPRTYGDLKPVRYYLKNPWRASLFRFIGPQGIRGFRKVRPVVYGEGLEVGYRGYRPGGTRPLFPFGFGLSYTVFAYSELELSETTCSRDDLASGRALEVSVTIANTGDRQGAEVVQVYVRDIESKLTRPFMELKGFTKVFLEPGEGKRVSVGLDWGAFSYFDDCEGQWVVEPGKFQILLCRCAGEVLLEEELTIY